LVDKLHQEIENKNSKLSQKDTNFSWPHQNIAPHQKQREGVCRYEEIYGVIGKDISIKLKIEQHHSRILLV